MNETSSHYVHGTDPEEQGRLSRMNDLLNDGSMRELALRGGERILDLGCGTGQLTRRMARAAGARGRVLGIDRSEEQLAEARRLAPPAEGVAPIEFRAGDVLALALGEDEWGSFDVAHTRFLLEHVPDPLAVVRAMAKAVRPGGRVTLEDEDHDILRAWPEPPGLRRVWEAYMESYRRAGNDPHVGLRMVQLLHQAGLEPRRTSLIWFGGCAGDPLFPTLVSNLIGVLKGARGPILEVLGDAPGYEAALAATREWGTRPDAAIWYAMGWAEATRP